MNKLVDIEQLRIFLEEDIPAKLTAMNIPNTEAVQSAISSAIANLASTSYVDDAVEDMATTGYVANTIADALASYITNTALDTALSDYVQTSAELTDTITLADNLKLSGVEDGEYVLRATVTGGVPAYHWEPVIVEDIDLEDEENEPENPEEE